MYNIYIVQWNLIIFKWFTTEILSNYHCYLIMLLQENISHKKISFASSFRRNDTCSAVIAILHDQVRRQLISTNCDGLCTTI